jgi:hypothetical protein
MTAATPAPWYAEGLAAMQAYEGGEGLGTDQRWVAVAKAVIDAHGGLAHHEEQAFMAEVREIRTERDKARASIADIRTVLEEGELDDTNARRLALAIAKRAGIEAVQ